MAENQTGRKYGLIPDARDARDKLFNAEPLGKAAELGNLERTPGEGRNDSEAMNKNGQA